jgi:hypothetical protein
MSIEEPKILQPEQPTLYCAECGSDVYPTATRCATCGKNLHEPGAMTSTRPYATATAKDKKRGRSLKERIFIVLMVAAVAIVIDAVEWQRRFHGTHGHLPTWILIVDIFVLLITLWFYGFFDCFDLW